MTELPDYAELPTWNWPGARPEWSSPPVTQ
jgi:hypothetical protein